MSEYWVAHKKYFCKYCNIYIADDAPSRRQHESGLRHKGNVERFVRGLYKAGEKRKQDLEEEKREMARVEKAAQAAFAHDVGAGLVKPGSSGSVAGPSTAKAGQKAAASLKPTNPYANYTTAESLGYTDPDEERRKAEAERRQKEGVAGEWEVVEVAPAPSEPEEQEDVKPSTSAAFQASARAGEKRPAEQPVDEEDTRGWKLRRKVARLGELYDPGALPIKLKAKKEEPEEETAAQALGSVSSTANAGATGRLPFLGGTEKPRWSARGWNKPAAGTRNTATPEPANSSGSAQDSRELEGVKPEDNTLPESLFKDTLRTSEGPPVSTVKAEDEQASVKPEPAEPEAPSSAPSGGSLFKKRKVPAGGGSKGGRQF